MRTIKIATAEKILDSLLTPEEKIAQIKKSLVSIKEDIIATKEGLGIFQKDAQDIHKELGIHVDKIKRIETSVSLASKEATNLSQAISHISEMDMRNGQETVSMLSDLSDSVILKGDFKKKEENILSEIKRLKDILEKSGNEKMTGFYPQPPTPGGSSGQIQYNNSGLSAGVPDWFTDANGQVTATALGTAHTPLTLNGITGQTANLQNWQVAGITKASIDATGSLMIPDGSMSAPSLKFASGIGMYGLAGQYLVVTNHTGYAPVAFVGSPSQIAMDGSTQINWAASTLGTIQDTGLAKSAAGILKITDGGAGYGTLSTGVYTGATTYEKVLDLHNPNATNSGTNWWWAIGNPGNYEGYLKLMWSGSTTQNDWVAAFDTSKQLQVPQGISTPYYRSSIQGLGDVQILQWVGSGVNYSGTEKVGLDHPYGNHGVRVIISPATGYSGNVSGTDFEVGDEASTATWFKVDNAGLTAIGSGGAYNFSSTTDAQGTPDVGLIRSAAGVLKVTDGSTGFGDLKASNIYSHGNLYVANPAETAFYVYGYTGGIGLELSTQLSWSGTANAAYAAKDIGLARSAAGILKVTDGGAGYGSLNLANLTASGNVTAGALKFSTLPPIYLNNAAAITGGLVAGQIYRSGLDPDVISVVH